MASTLDFPLKGSSHTVVRQCGPMLCDVLQSKFGCVATINCSDSGTDQSAAHQKGRTVVPEMRYNTVLPSGVVVAVWKADLTHFSVEAVVNAANSGLSHWGGLADALSRAGGPQIQKDSDDYISKYGKINTGDAIVTDAGMLPCKKIIHAVGPHVSKSPTVTEVEQASKLLEKTILSILERVRQHHLKSVAIPAISSGLFNFPLMRCASIIVSTIKVFYEKSSAKGHLPSEVLLVNNDEPSVKEMEAACRQILWPHVAVSQSSAGAAPFMGKRKGKADNAKITIELGKIHLTLKRGSIELQQTDVIVNTTLPNGDLNCGQISRALLQKAGKGIQQEMYGMYSKGLVVCTKSYKLQCKQVYHTFCTNNDKDTAELTLYKSVQECLRMASASQHTSIAFPAIGTGGLGFDKDKVAKIMTTAVGNFAQTATRLLDVHFVIFASDNTTFEAFERQMRSLQQVKPDHASISDDGVHARGAPTPRITLHSPSEEAAREAERWLRSLLSCDGVVVIRNNFLPHLGEGDCLQLSALAESGLSVEEHFTGGHASVMICGDSVEAAVAGVKVEAMLCSARREFVRQEEDAISLSTGSVFFQRKLADHSECLESVSTFRKEGLSVLKVERVENATLQMVFDHKKNQLNCSTPRKMYQRIPAQFCETVCRIGFHAEFATPDDPAFGEGIYFAGTVKKAMEVWREQSEEYLYFVVADVLTGTATAGRRGLILPPAVGSNPMMLYHSVSGGPDVSVVFSGYQALPKYIVTCKNGGVSSSL